ncbi:hypothetical protein K493DRAFT_321896 [Basidiobolus meristosporus CBS 931.73]|uniref:Uncharacterized protein n=1 Tax=Basidiobolus meristosporus CBS 931.73 TaxID=1314790 RepID=A0A1Y1VVP3_9FUNG|nr:hypothetical protein K493DRAFT_321896 [Basidiobolus meristosporus CBS 931.73]|eukprot:ORX65372.1 hypothetical protein K493DRAFT_321896 [Basidiobolus meristosporus CBS 931.73]
MSDHQELARNIRGSLAKEIQEIILYYVGDVVLYFGFFETPGVGFRRLVIHQGGPGYALEEAIKSGHKPLIRWLLTAVVYPVDYLLTSAVCYGDIGVLSYLIGLIGEEYKNYDTPAKLLCLLKGKVRLCEHLFHENPVFREGGQLTKCIHNCLLVGISKSSEAYSWYLKNQHILPPIGREDRIKVCLQLDRITEALELVGNEGTALLGNALMVAPSGSEETYRMLILNYASEENVLSLIARACVRLGYVDTLELLFNEPYNVHVEYDFFVGIPNLAVVEVLHKYASRRNSISGLFRSGCIQRVKTRLGAYKTRKSYLRLLRTFAESSESQVQRRRPRWAGPPSEDVSLFLVDLAEVTSSARLVKKYVLYAIECGHLRLLRKLVPLLKEKALQRIAQGIGEVDLELGILDAPIADASETEYPNVYRSGQPELVEYLFELGIYQPSYLQPLMEHFDLKFVQNLLRHGLVTMDQDDGLAESGLETKEGLAVAYFNNAAAISAQSPHLAKDRFVEFIHFLWGVLPCQEYSSLLNDPQASSISFSTYAEFSRQFPHAIRLALIASRFYHIYWVNCQDILNASAEMLIRKVSHHLAFFELAPEDEEEEEEDEDVYEDNENENDEDEYEDIADEEFEDEDNEEYEKDVDEDGGDDEDEQEEGLA